MSADLHANIEVKLLLHDTLKTELVAPAGLEKGSSQHTPTAELGFQAGFQKVQTPQETQKVGPVTSFSPMRGGLQESGGYAGVSC